MQHLRPTSYHLTLFDPGISEYVRKQGTACPPPPLPAVECWHVASPRAVARAAGGVRGGGKRRCPAVTPLLEDATIHGRAWYNFLDAPVLTLDVTVCGDRSRWEGLVGGPSVAAPRS